MNYAIDRATATAIARAVHKAAHRARPPDAATWVNGAPPLADRHVVSLPLPLGFRAYYGVEERTDGPRRILLIASCVAGGVPVDPVVRAVAAAFGFGDGSAPDVETEVTIETIGRSRGVRLVQRGATAGHQGFHKE